MDELQFGFYAATGNVNVSKINKNWKRLSCATFSVCYNPLPKFEDDKLFFETEDRIVLLDGVIFNKDELMRSYPSVSWQDRFLILIETNPASFMDELRGSFSGIVYSKRNNTLVAYTNHSGEKTVYYTQCEEGFVLASHVDFLQHVLHENGKKLSPCIDANYEMLLTGSILHGKTPFESVFRITAGKVALFSETSVRLDSYHVFRNIPEHELTLDECIEKADVLFRQAVDRIFRKSKEYGYQAECDLSGGLDSRMATWVAHDLGYSDILNICYCVEGNLDHTISKKIANDLGNPYLFIPMDASVLTDVDRKTRLSGGQVLYCLSTGALKAMEIIKEKNIGLCCTGLLGEIQNAYWTEGDKHTTPNYISNRKSYFYELTIPEEYSREYDNFEQMNLYEYSTNLFMLSALTRQQYTEVVSPFVDVDYLDFAYKIPLKWRKNYQFIQAYMCKKYPQAAKYVWQTMLMPVDKHYKRELYLPKYSVLIRSYVARAINKMCRKFKLHSGVIKLDDMNPIDVWIKTDNKARELLQEYCLNNFELVRDDLLRERLETMYHTTKLPTDLVQIVYVLSVYRNYLL